LDSVIKGRSLSEPEVKELLNYKADDITKQFMEDNFAFTEKKNPKYCPQDYFVLPAGKLYNDKAESTTVGRYIWNLFLLTDKLGPLLKYMNYPFDNGKLKKLNNSISQFFLEDKISATDVYEYFDKTNWFFSISYFINSSLQLDFVMTNPKIKESKEKLLAEHADDISNGNVVTISKIEKELIGEAKEIFKDHPSMQIYDSGCRGSFGNNYKNTSIIRGAMKDFADPSKTFISTTSLDEGIIPSEYKYYCDMSIQGTYSKAIETQSGKNNCSNKILLISGKTKYLVNQKLNFI